MRTRTLIIGLVIMVAGIVLAVVGANSLRSNTTNVTTFTQPTPGEYVSAELVLNDSVVVVRFPVSVGGMVPTQDVGAVNVSNIGSYAIAYNSTAASSETYIGLRGDFNYVAFSSTQPVTKVVVTGTLTGTVRSGLLVLAGIVCAIAGIIVVIVGIVRKNPAKKATSPDDEYYAKRDSTLSSSLRRPE